MYGIHFNDHDVKKIEKGKRRWWKQPFSASIFSTHTWSISPFSYKWWQGQHPGTRKLPCNTADGRAELQFTSQSLYTELPPSFGFLQLSLSVTVCRARIVSFLMESGELDSFRPLRQASCRITALPESLVHPLSSPRSPYSEKALVELAAALYTAERLAPSSLCHPGSGTFWCSSLLDGNLQMLPQCCTRNYWDSLVSLLTLQVDFIGT